MRSGCGYDKVEKQKPRKGESDWTGTVAGLGRQIGETVAAIGHRLSHLLLNSVIPMT